MQNRNDFLSKMCSGRFWLTIMAGLVFMWCSYKGMLKPESIAAILAMVFSNYFNKHKEG